VPAVSTTIFYRRRAERFAQLLDEANGGRRHHVRSAVDDDLAELVAVGHRVSALQRSVDVQVDPEFRVGLRAMLVAAAERESMGAVGDGQATIDLEAFRAAAKAGTRPARTARRLRTRGAIIAGVACGAIAVSGMSAASENAVPGDALYGVKRSTERAQLAMAGSDVTRGQLALDFARNRLAEATALGGSSGFAGVLNDMDADTRQGVRLLTTSAVDRKDNAPLTPVDRFVIKQRIVLTPAIEMLSPANQKRAAESLALLDKVQERAEDLTARLGCDPLGRNGTDALGPKLADCMTGTGDSGVTEQPSGKSEKQGSKTTAADPAGKDGKSKTDPAPSGVPVVPSVSGPVTLPEGEKPARSVGTAVSPSPSAGGIPVPEDPRAEEEKDLLRGLIGGARR
jgi:hypothetical protein